MDHARTGPDLGFLEIAFENQNHRANMRTTLNSTNATRRTRQDKPTVRIPFRTVSECEGLLVAYTACQNLGLPTPDCNR